MTGLYDELLSVLGTAMTASHVDRLLHLGVPPATTIMCGLAKIRPDGQNYVPDDDGLEAVIVPVFDGGVVVDLVAFQPAQPELWWVRRGETPFLGSDALERLWLNEPLRLHRDPLGWLRGGAQPNAAVVLSWKAAATQIFAVPSIVADDYEYALEIEQHLKATRTIPNISFPADARTAA